MYNLCKDCESVARYMAADTEMYRGERRECDRCRDARETLDAAQRRIAELEARLAAKETETP